MATAWEQIVELSPPSWRLLLWFVVLICVYAAILGHFALETCQPSSSEEEL